MRNSITYAGVNSATVGLVVEKFPSMNRPARKFEKVSVMGRNGDLYFLQDAFSNIEQEYEIWCPKGQFSDVLNFLYPEERGTTVEDILRLEVNGYKQLQDSYDPNVTRLACVTNGFDVENLRNRYARATITFDCRPERFTADAFDFVDITSEGVRDTTPYTYRTSTKGMVYPTLVGGTVAMNQLAGLDASMWGATRVSISVSNHTITATTTSASSLKYISISLRQNHKYLFRGTTTASAEYSAVYGVYNGDTSTYSYRDSVTAGTTEAVEIIVNANYTDSQFRPLLFATSAPSDISASMNNPQLIDLTQMFGSTIADYVYSLEQATAGSGIAWLKSYGFFTESYYAYNSGELVSANPSARKVVGKNLANFVDGYNINTQGQIATYAGRIATVDPIIIKSNIQYKILALLDESTIRFTCCVWNGDTIVRRTANIYSGDTLDVSGGTHFYVCAYSGSVSLTVASTKAMVILSTETDLSYSPYTLTTYPLGSDTLRGIYKLNGSNLYCEGDTKTSNGTITRKYKVITLDGTQTLQNSSFGGTVNVIGRWTLSDVAKAYGGDDIPNIVSDKLKPCKSSLAGSFAVWRDDAANSNAVTISTNGSMVAIAIADLSITNNTQLNAYLSNNPITIVYELATSTTESSTAFQSPQIVGSTEEIVSDVPCGQNSLYFGTSQLTNTTNRTAKPCLKITGSGTGTVTCNGTVISISNIPTYIYIDSDSQNCFKDMSSNLNNLVTLSDGFPMLYAGDNQITFGGGVTSVEVMPRWWRL